jgi:hypothetical protein
VLANIVTAKICAAWMPSALPSATDEGGSNVVLYTWRSAVEEDPVSGSLAAWRAET